MIIAVDFDGTLCEYAFPNIGAQTQEQKDLMKTLIEMQKNDHKIILWTNRGDSEQYPVLTEAVQWCADRGLVFDAINENVKGQKKISGYSPKVMADLYIDDKAVNVKDWKKII